MSNDDIGVAMLSIVSGIGAAAVGSLFFAANEHYSPEPKKQHSLLQQTLSLCCVTVVVTGASLVVYGGIRMARS